MNNIDIIMEVQAEERAYYKWEREQKNKILSMHDPNKKREVWHRLFPTMSTDDSWLDKAEVF